MSTSAAPAEHAEDRSAPDRLALAAFVGAVLIGGTNFVAVRFSNRELDPIWGAGLRFALAAAIFGVLCLGLRTRLPHGRLLGLVALYGLLGFGAAYACMYWALQDVPAGVAAIVLAVGPLLTLLLAVAHRLERLSGRALAGAVVAIVGTGVLFAQSRSDGFRWESLVVLVLAALFASEAVVVSKRIGRQSPVAMNFVGMGVAAVVLVAAAALTGERLVLPTQGETQLAVAYLVAASVALFVLVLVVVQRWTASATAYTFVLMPVVAVAAGALLADESVGAATLVGGAIICAGVYLGALARR